MRRRATSSSTWAWSGPPPRDRGKYFYKKPKHYPGLKLVALQPADFDRKEAFNETCNLLLTHPDMDAIYGNNDNNIVAAAGPYLYPLASWDRGARAARANPC